MTPRLCCVCKRESFVSVTRFPLLRTGYPLGAKCRASWRKEARSLGGDRYNPAKVQIAFRRWCATRKAAA